MNTNHCTDVLRVRIQRSPFVPACILVLTQSSSMHHQTRWTRLVYIVQDEFFSSKYDFDCFSGCCMWHPASWLFSVRAIALSSDSCCLSIYSLIQAQVKLFKFSPDCNYSWHVDVARRACSRELFCESVVNSCLLSVCQHCPRRSVPIQHLFISY